MRVILGSSSRFRKKLLCEILGNSDFEVMKPEIDEKAVLLSSHLDRSSSPPDQLVVAIAKAKANKVLGDLGDDKNTILITCDQVVVYENRIREKPQSIQECRRYLKSYENHPAITCSGIVVTNTKTGEQISGFDIAKQYFKKIPEDIIDKLVEKGDIMHCAGGFMIDDPLIGPFLDRREGEEESIIGLPKKLLKNLLERSMSK